LDNDLKSFKLSFPYLTHTVYQKQIVCLHETNWSLLPKIPPKTKNKKPKTKHPPLAAPAPHYVSYFTLGLILEWFKSTPL